MTNDTKINKGQKPKTIKKEKKFSITKYLFTVGQNIGGLEGMKMLLQRSELLTNGYRQPIPNFMLNQRQRRKRARQTGIYC